MLSTNPISRAAAAAAAPLPRSTPEAQGISSGDLLAYVDAADKTIDQMNGFMLVRHGKVVAEGWWTPYDARTRHVLYSLTKSFTSTAVGFAVSEGKLSVDDEVTRFFPDELPAELSENLKQMRVKDLLRMVVGHEKEVHFEGNDPWTKQFLAHPVAFNPGTHFLYNTPGSYMLSAIVQKVTGQTEEDYLRPRLFEPLGIENWTWAKSPQGISTGGYGLSVHTEDIAKFGLTYLNRGKYNGKQVVPADWVEQATRLQTSNGSGPHEWAQGYGYQFWRCRHNCYRGDGAFGQFCIVMPDQDAVVAITSGVKDMQGVMNLVWDKLLPAMKSDALPEDPAAQEKLTSRLQSLQVKRIDGKPTSSIASKVSGKVYQFPDNDKGISSLSIDFGSSSPVLTVRGGDRETHTTIGIGTWARNEEGFANGLNKGLGMPEHPQVGATGGWTSDDTFTAKLVLNETPYYTTMQFKFDGDTVTLSSEHNVNFGPTTQPVLSGHQ